MRIIRILLKQILNKGRYNYLLGAGLFLFSIFWGGYNGKYITGDGHGYYAYLPRLFLYPGDFQYSINLDLQKKYYGKENVSDFRKKIDDQYVNKYFAGVSVLWIPFFLLAHFFALIFRLADGFSAPYQLSIGLAAVFYLWIGLYYLRRLLLSYRISEHVVSFVSLWIVLGTNLSYFTLFDASYTHVYSFSIITAFLFYIRKFFLYQKLKSLYKSVFFLGFVLAIRPVNLLIILFIPLLGKDWENIKQSFFLIKIHHFFIILLILFPFAFYQMCWWNAQTGHWIIWPYVGESFDFAHPHMFAFLFSYKKGVFVYAPVLLFSLFGLWYVGKKSRFTVFAGVVYFLMVVYVLSSWQPWWYGMSYGSRPVIDYYACFAIPMGIGLKSVHKKGRTILFLLGLFFVTMNMMQEYQYKNFILHWENMNKSSYWKVFLRTNKKWRGYLWK